MGNSNLTNLTIRIDKDTKKCVEGLFDDMGMNMTSAITIFLKQVARDKRFPFNINLNPLNAEAMSMIKDVREIVQDKTVPEYDTVDDLMKDLNL